MTDLTAITTPFGLLDDETKAALVAHGGPYEFFSRYGEWTEVICNHPAWFPCDTYRVKPQPPKPREWWVNLYPDGSRPSYAWRSREAAEQGAAPYRLECVHVREVLE